MRAVVIALALGVASASAARLLALVWARRRRLARFGPAGLAALGILAGLLLRSGWFALVFGALGAGIIQEIRRHLAIRRRTLIQRHALAACDRIVAAVTVEPSLPRIFRQAARGLPRDVAQHLQRAATALEMGADRDAVLTALGEALPARELQMFFSAMRLYGTSGAEPHKLLRAITESLRARERRYHERAAKFAEGWMGLWIAIAGAALIPAVVASRLPGYGALLVGTSLGRGLVGGALLVIAGAVVVLRGLMGEEYR